jgi:hypothetical protein
MVHCLQYWDFIRGVWEWIPPHGFLRCVIPS